MNNYNNAGLRIAYMGGEPVRCPRCSNVVATRFCPFCNLDLSTVYSKPAPQQQTMPIQGVQHIPPEEIISTYIHPVGVNKPPVYPQQPRPYTPYQPPLNNPQYPYYISQTQKKNKSGVVTLVVILGVLLFFSAIFLGFNSLGYLLDDSAPINPFGDSFSPPQKQEEFFFPAGVSSEEYKKLKIGMSYAQISSIIGGDGEIVDRGETLKKEIYYVYCWYGETNPEALVYVTITTDAVTDISLEGGL